MLSLSTRLLAIAHVIPQLTYSLIYVDVRRYKILYFTLTPGRSRVELGHVVGVLGPDWLVCEEKISDWLVSG